MKRSGGLGISLEVLMGAVVFLLVFFLLILPGGNMLWKFLVNKPDQGSINSFHNFEQDIVDLTKKAKGEMHEVPYYVGDGMYLTVCADTKNFLCLHKKDGVRVERMDLSLYRVSTVTVVGGKIVGGERKCDRVPCNVALTLTESPTDAKKFALSIEDVE